MPLTRTSTGIIVSADGPGGTGGTGVTHTRTYTTTLTITPNPLTTAFEAPAHCTQSYLSNCQTDAVSGTLPCFVSVYPEGVCDSDGQSCYPAVPGALGNTYLYSPGLACPAGWTTAWREVSAPSGEDEETTAHCCPSGLSVTTYGTFSTWCEGTVTRGEAETLVVNGLSECPASTTAFAFGPGTPVGLAWVDVESTRVSVSGEAALTVSAQRVALLYRSSDLTGAGATASGTRGSPAPTGTGAGAGAVGGGGGGGSGLSTGAVAGIAAAAAAVGVAAVLGAFCVFLRRRGGKGGGRAGRGGGRGGFSGGGGPASGHAQDDGSAGGSASPRVRHELKAGPPGASQRSPSPDAWSRVSPVTELQGSTPSSGRMRAGASSHGSGGGNREGGGMVGIHEAPGLDEHHQVPVTAAGVHRHDSRQATPIHMVRQDKHAGGPEFYWGPDDAR